MVFFIVFPASFADERANKEPCGLLLFSRIKRVKLDELSFIVRFSTLSFVNACLWAVGAMSPLLLRLFK